MKLNLKLILEIVIIGGLISYIFGAFMGETGFIVGAIIYLAAVIVDTSKKQKDEQGK